MRSVDPSVGISHARTARECMDRASNGGIDLVFLDLGLPDKPGLEALADLKEAYPDLPVVVLSGHEERSTVLECINPGAMGFIPKSSEDPKLLWHALKLALSGAVTVPPFVTQSESSRRSETSTAGKREIGIQDLRITPRQIDVLRLLVQGLPNKSIARRLDIAETTARGYVSELLAAFCVTNRTQLVLEVARRGLNIGTPSAPRAKG